MCEYQNMSSAKSVPENCYFHELPENEKEQQRIWAKGGIPMPAPRRTLPNGDLIVRLPRSMRLDELAQAWFLDEERCNEGD